MKSYSAGAIELLESGIFVRRNLIWVEMDDDPVGFWDDAYDAEIEERTYLGVYDAMQITPLGSAADLGMRSVSVTINGLDGRVQSQVLDQPYHQRPIFISRALISPETQQVIEIDQWFAGFIDKIKRREKLGGTSVLEVLCEGIGREFNRSGARTRSDADHKQLSPGDPFFEHVVAANNVPLQWGQVQNAKQKSSSWLDKIF